MKTKKNFLKKLTAGILGFVMTLGVGAAGYAGAASETHAESTTYTFSSKSWADSTSSWTSGKDGNGFTGGQGVQVTTGATGAYATTKSSISNVSKIVINYCTNASKGKGTIKVQVGSNTEKTYSVSAPSSGGTTLRNTDEFVFSPAESGQVKLTVECGTNSIYINSCTITTADAPASNYTVSFNSNGGSNSMSSATTSGNTYVAPSCSFDPPDGKEFDKWALGSASGTQYAAGETISGISSNITLYAVWKDSGSQPSDNSYKIVFSTGSGDGTSVDTDTSVSDIVSSGSSYVTGKLVTATKAYKAGGSGLKLGTSSDAGTIKFNLSDAGKVKATSIVVRAKRYSSSKATKIKVNGSATQDLTSDFANYTFTQTGTSAISYIEIVSSKGTSGGAYCWISDITVNYAPTVVHTVGSISGASEVYVGKTANYTTSCDQSDGITWSVEPGLGTASINSSTGVLTGGTAGTVTVKATCAGGASSTKTVTIKNDVETLVSIAVSGQQTTFTKGANFSFGGTVTGTYSHENGDPNSTKTISSGITYKIDGTTATTATTLNDVGNHSVVVSAGGKSATAYNISVNYADVEAITLAYSENTIGKGAEATLPGVTISPANANQGSSWGSPVPSDDGIDYSFEPSTNKLTISNSNNVAGTISFTATAAGDSTKTATVVYTVEVAQIAHITAVNASATGTIIAKQYVGDAFNPQGFSFEPVWSEGEHDPVTINAGDIQWNALVAGNAPTGTYSCADGNFTVTISGVTVANDELVSIDFANGCDMTNKSYWEGDSWNFAGLSIVGTMDSGKTASIDDSKVSFTTSDPVSAGTTSITVTAHYQGFSGIEPTKVITGIQVQTPEITDLVVNYTGGQPTLGDDFVFAGTIKANMSHGPQQDVDLSDVTIGEVNKFITTQQTITVTHNDSGKTGTFNVQYKVASYTTMSEDTHVYSYDKVTSSQTDWRGKYLIVYETGSLAMDGSLETLDAVSNTKSVTISNNSISTDADGKINENAIYFTVDYKGTSTSIYSLKSASGKYISGTTTSAKAGNGIKQAENPDNYEISFNGTTLESKSSDKQMMLKYNKNDGQTRFRFYSSGQEAIALYKWTDHVTPGHEIPSDEKHAIRIGDVTCNKSPLIAGETISASDFKIQVQYDTGTSFTDNLTPTSVSPSTLVAGTNTYTITYTGSYNDTVTKEIQLTAQNPAVLESIYVTKDTGSGVFTRGDAFNTNGIHVWARYTDSTTYPDVEVTSKATITPVSVEDMNVAGTKTVNVSYTEGSTQISSYEITVNIKNSTYVTISGDGIEGSAGSYSLDCGLYKEVQLTLNKDGDETIVPSTLATFLSYNESTGVLTVNSSAAVSETGTITFTSGNASATLTVNVTANPLTSFVAAGTPSVAKQFRNSSFVLNLDGVTINGVYLDGTSTEFAASQFTWDTTGEHPVGTYKENENLTVIVNSITLADDSIKSISFVSGSDMSNKNYWVGEDWDYNGLSLTGEMESGLTATLDPSKISFSADKTTENSMEDGSITVTGHYEGFDGAEPTLVVNGINVTAIQMTYLTVNYTGGSPYLGDDFSFDGTITAHYNNGDTETVSLSDVTIDAVDKFTTDLQTITVTHNNTGATGTFNVQYQVKEYWTDPEIKHEYSWDKVTSDQTDWSGIYLIAVDGKVFNGVDAANGIVEGSITDNKMTFAEGMARIEITKMDGGYSLKILDGTNKDKYISGKSGNNTIVYGTSAVANEITYSDSGITILSNSTSFRFNNGSSDQRFRFYKTSTTGSNYCLPTLYKYTDHQSTIDPVKTDEQHPIRIVDATCTAESKLIGDTITKNDFNISVQYDTSVTPVQNLTPTSIQRKTGENTYSDDCTLGAGDNIFKLTYSETYNGVTYTVTKEVVVPAAAKTLDSISLSFGDSFKDSFGIGDTFSSEGVIVTANYLNGYESEVVTNVSIDDSEVDMNTAGTYTVYVSYTESGVTKTASYNITVSAEKDANLIGFTSEDTGATATLVDEKSATFTGYVENTVSVQIQLVNFGNDVDVDEKSAVDGLSLSGSVSNGIYNGTITISKEMIDQSYTITVSDGDKSFDIVLSFTAVDDYIVSIEASDYTYEYTVGDTFEFDGKVTATYVSGKTEELKSGYSVSDLGTLSTRGQQTVVVTLNGSSSISDSFEITVNKPELNIVTEYEIPGEGSYHLVTDASELGSGDQILIVGIDGETYYALAPYVSGNNCKPNEVATPVDDAISTDVAYITLGGSSGAWTLYDGTYYLYGAGGDSNNYLKGKTSTDTLTAYWTISINEEGVATIKCLGDIDKNWLRYNTNNDLFSCYSSGQSDVYIYKFETVTGYQNNTEISDELYDFVVAWGDELSTQNWGDIFESDEFNNLDTDDTALLQKAVEENADGSVVTSEMFVDFINAYDEIVSKNGPDYNILDRSVEYEHYTVQIGTQEATTYQAGDVCILPDATPVVEDNKIVYVSTGNEVFDAGQEISVHENLVLSAVEIQDVEKISVSTEANYKYNTDDNGNFSGVTQTTLRMYISMDADTYNFYVNHGYDFSIVIVNSKNGKSSIINSSSMSIKYDAEKDVYVFNVAFNIPASQYSTDLQISLIASSQFASDETLKVTVNYMSAAESLYQAYLNGSVTLNSKQVAALKAILNIVD